MGIWAELNIREEERQDFLHQAAQQRLVRQALAGRRQFVQRRHRFQVDPFQAIKLALAGLLSHKFHLQTK